jgi:hypothetical protein
LGAVLPGSSAANRVPPTPPSVMPSSEGKGGQSFQCRSVPPLQEVECFLHVPLFQHCLDHFANALRACRPIVAEGSPDETFCPSPLCARQFPDSPQGHPLSDQGPSLVGDPIIPLPLAQLGFDTLRNKMAERLCLFSLLPLGQLKREALLVALV